MESYIKFWTFFQYPPHYKFREPTVECLGLYFPLGTCNCYLDISQWKHLNCGCVTFCNITTIVISVGSVTQTLAYFTTKFSDGYTRYLEIVYQLLSSYITEPDNQCKYVILRCVRITPVVLKSNTYFYSLSEASVIQHAKLMYRVIICDMSCSITFFHYIW